MALTDAKCRNAKPREKMYKLTDRDGLHLRNEPNGAQLWRWSYRWNGKQKDLALGKYPMVTLLEARKARDEAARLLRDGVDPSLARKRAKAATTCTFAEIATEYQTKLRAEGRAEATLHKTAWLLQSALREFGTRSVGTITPTEVIDLAKREFQDRKRYDSANRLLTTLSCVFRLAVQSGKITFNPASDRRGALIRPKHKHHAAVLDPHKLGSVLRSIDAYGGQPITAAALKLLPLVFLRPGELRGGRWTEVDFEAAIWTIDGARTKNRKPLKVPLARQALQILGEVKVIGYRSPYIFPSLRGLNNPNGSPLSENTLNAAFRSMGYGQDEVTAHGFRATASTLLNEAGLWNPDAIERQLNHVQKNEVRAAYDRATHWEERVKMMQWWAEFCQNLTSPQGKVVALRGV